MLIVTEFLCGCNDYIPEKREFKIGESVTFENIKYTFLSAYWNNTVYTLEIKGENIGSNKQEVNIITLGTTGTIRSARKKYLDKLFLYPLNNIYSK